MKFNIYLNQSFRANAKNGPEMKKMNSKKSQIV